MRENGLLILIGMIVGLLVFYGIVGAFIVNASEDSALFNCHLSGNMTCGSTPGPLGFSNL